MTYSFICQVCGKHFTDQKHPNRKYCSPGCYSQGRKSIVTKNCLHCNKEFAVTVSNQNRKFCSPTCSNRYNQPKDPTKRAIFICQWCNTEFEEWVYRQPRFCSNHCRSKFAAIQPKFNARKPESFVTRNCAICEKPYTVHKCQVELRDSKYCSNECKHEAQSRKVSKERNPNWQGGIEAPYYGPNWDRQKRKTKKRDDYTCQACGYKAGGNRFLDVHHIIPFRFFDDYKTANDLSNLITLCRNCHIKAEIELRASP